MINIKGWAACAAADTLTSRAIRPISLRVADCSSALIGGAECSRSFDSGRFWQAGAAKPDPTGSRSIINRGMISSNASTFNAGVLRDRAATLAPVPAMDWPEYLRCQRAGDGRHA